MEQAGKEKVEVEAPAPTGVEVRTGPKDPKDPVPALELALLLVKQLRPKQWAKNLIILAPLLFSGKVSDSSADMAACLCVISFCLVSSGIYVLNDVIDVKADRAHPTKKNRPIASGRLNIQLAAAMGVICFLGGLSLAFYVRHSLVIIYLAYVIMNVAYSMRLKHIPIVDALCIASGFVMRAVAGAVAIFVTPSSWFLLCTTFGALFLGLDKRRQELKLLSEGSSTHRQVLVAYSPALLTRMENVIVPSLLTSYAFYSFQSEHGQWMMLTVPIVLYGVLRYQLLSEQSTDTGAPEEVLWKDKPIQITLILWVAVCAMVIYGHPEVWLNRIADFMDSFKLSS